MERELIITGVGGQGVQLAAQILARAAVLEDRHVVMLGTYGGSMRGGSTDSTLVVGDAPVASPPIVSRSWSAVALHPRFYPPVAARLRPDALVVSNATLFEDGEEGAVRHLFRVPAGRMADELGSPLVASLILLAAYARVTGLVGVETLVEAMRQSVPSYRRQHVSGNEKALRAGFAVLPAGAVPAWPAAGAAP